MKIKKTKCKICFMIVKRDSYLKCSNTTIRFITLYDVCVCLEKTSRLVLLWRLGTSLIDVRVRFVITSGSVSIWGRFTHVFLTSFCYLGASINSVAITVEAGPSSSSPENISRTSQDQQKLPDVSFDELLLRSTKRENNPDPRKRKRLCLGAEVITRALVDEILSKNLTKNIKPENKTKKIKRFTSESYLKAVLTMIVIHGTAIQVTTELLNLMS